MSGMYVCNHCKETFSEDEIELRNDSFWVPYGEYGCIKPEYTEICPYCGSEDFEEDDDDDDKKKKKKKKKTEKTTEVSSDAIPTEQPATQPLLPPDPVFLYLSGD